MYIKSIENAPKKKESTTKKTQSNHSQFEVSMKSNEKQDTLPGGL